MDTLPIRLLKPNPENPRTELGDVEELVESIARFGIIEPVVVAPQAKHYLVVCGHRRVAAAKRAGLTEVPVVIREMDAADRELIALTENVHRRQLSPIEEAIAYARLMKTRGLNQTGVAALMHVSPATVSIRMALLRLPKDIIAQVHAGRLSVQDALGMERDGRRHSTDPQPAKFNAGRKSRCTLEGHVNCDARKCEVRKLERRSAVA